MNRIVFDLFDTLTWATGRPSAHQTQYTLEQEIADARERSLYRSKQMQRD